MELSTILREIADYPAVLLKKADDGINIRACKLITPGQTAFSPELLYYSSGNDCPPLPNSILVTVLFRDCESVPKQYMESNNYNIIIPGNGMNSDTLFNQIYELLM